MTLNDMKITLRLRYGLKGSFMSIRHMYMNTDGAVCPYSALMLSVFVHVF